MGISSSDPPTQRLSRFLSHQIRARNYLLPRMKPVNRCLTRLNLSQYQGSDSTETFCLDLATDSLWIGCRGQVSIVRSPGSKECRIRSSVPFLRIIPRAEFPSRYFDPTYCIWSQKHPRAVRQGKFHLARTDEYLSWFKLELRSSHFEPKR